MGPETGGSGPATGCFAIAEFRASPTWPADFRPPGTQSATGYPLDRSCPFSEIPPVPSGSAPPETGMMWHGGTVMTRPFTAMQKGCRGSPLPAFRYSPKTDRADYGWGFCDLEKANPK